jgi:hypothetical protein
LVRVFYDALEGVMLRGVLDILRVRVQHPTASADHTSFPAKIRASALAGVLMIVAGLASGCTRIELENKAEAYDAAIAESSNELILLNAVRASQRAPMSFVSLGQVLANPNVSANATSTFNFDRLLGLTTYSVTPSAAVGGGFTQYTMTNINTDKVMSRMRQQIPPELINYFAALKWPEELTDLLFIASITIRPDVYNRIVHRAHAICAHPPHEGAKRICDAIDAQLAERELAKCYDYPERGFIYNSAREICSMAKFQIFVRMARLQGIHPLDRKHFGYTPHTALGMLYYLGELIAAQNYSVRPYIPRVLIGTPSDGFRLVPLFVVRRGIAVPGEAAVHVYHRGEPFFIPRPELGSVDEARSLQVLDFVSQVISAQITDDNIPKVSTIGLVATR